jgi:hypothetical protein
MPLSIETRLCLMRYLVYDRDYSDVVFGEHRLKPFAKDEVKPNGVCDPYLWWRCSCGWVGHELELGSQRVDGQRLEHCPVVDLEHEEHESYLKAQQKAAGAVCVLCGVNWVDVMAGFDTCRICQPRKH